MTDANPPTTWPDNHRYWRKTWAGITDMTSQSDAELAQVEERVLDRANIFCQLSMGRITDERATELIRQLDEREEQR